MFGHEDIAVDVENVSLTEGFEAVFEGGVGRFCV